MATYIPSNQSLATSALSNWGQGQRQQQSLNMRAAQSQLQELARLGISNEDPRKRKALGTIMAGGNPLAMLLNNSGDVPTLQSSQYQTGGGGGQSKQYAPSAQSQKKLSSLQSQSSGLVLQEDIRQSEKDVADLRAEREALAMMGDAASQDEKNIVDDKLGLAQNRLTGGLKELEKSDYWKEGGKKNIADSNYFLPDAKGKWKPIPKDATKGIGETIAKPREEMDVVTKQIDKEKTQFLKDDAKRLNESVKTGGPMTGTETQMRAKVRRDFKILSDQAGGNTDSLRKVYDDYVTDMKSIDYNFRRKPYYPSFEKQFASLFRGRKSSGGRSGGDKGAFGTGFALGNPITGTTEYFNEISATNRADALKKVKIALTKKMKVEYDKGNIEEYNRLKKTREEMKLSWIVGKDKISNKGVRNYVTTAISGLRKDTKENYFLRQKKERTQKEKDQNFNTVMSNAGNLTGKTDIGFNNTDLKKAISAVTGLTLDDQRVSDLFNGIDNSTISDKYKTLYGVSPARANNFLKSIIITTQNKGIGSARNIANQTGTNRIILRQTK